MAKATARTQKDAVIKYLKTHKGITSWDAIQKLGITRLSAVIFNIRNYDEKYDIWTEMRTGENRYGNSVNYAVYHLTERKK